MVALSVPNHSKSTAAPSFLANPPPHTCDSLKSRWLGKLMSSLGHQSCTGCVRRYLGVTSQLKPVTRKMIPPTDNYPSLPNFSINIPIGGKKKNNEPLRSIIHRSLSRFQTIFRTSPHTLGLYTRGLHYLHPRRFRLHTSVPIKVDGSVVLTHIDQSQFSTHTDPHN